MTALNMITLLIIILLILAIGSYLCHEHRRQRASELDAALERAEIRRVAEDAMSSAASNAAVIDKMGSAGHKRRTLHAVRDHNAGTSTWRFE